MRVINFTAGTEGNRRISDISELGTVRVRLISKRKQLKEFQYDFKMPVKSD